MVAITSYIFSTAAVATALFISGVAAAPTPAGSPPVPTHTVAVGRAGLNFDPDNIVAEIGEVVEFHYLPNNHSVVQSTFGAPCVPSEGGFFSGFMFTPTGQNPNVFQITIKDKNPIWFYCSQTNKNHCQSGMSGAINQNFDGAITLANYRKAAAQTGTSVSPPTVQGGAVIPNPNPLSGV